MTEQDQFFLLVLRARIVIPRLLMTYLELMRQIVISGLFKGYQSNFSGPQLVNSQCDVCEYLRLL